MRRARHGRPRPPRAWGRPRRRMSMYVLALDQGTTSSRAIVFDAAGNAVASQAHEFKQHYPEPGWVEHDPNEIWDTQLRAARGALSRAKIAASDLGAIG